MSNNNEKIIFQNYKDKYQHVITELKKDNDQEVLSKLREERQKLKSNIGEAKQAYINAYVKENNISDMLILDISNGRYVNPKHTVNMLIEGIKNIESISKDVISISDNIQKDPKGSTELFSSMVTLTDWIEEITENNNPMGLLFTINTSKYAKSGINWDVNDVSPTSTIFPLSDFITQVAKKVKYSNLNNAKVINDRVLGRSNCIIPLYINKHHWKIAKHYIKPCMSIIIYHDPLIYKKECMYYIFNILADMTCDMDKADEKKIKIYISFLRTCAEIAFMFGFNRGIRHIIKRFIKDPKLRCVHDYKRYIGQILCTGYVMEDDINVFICKIISIIQDKITDNDDMVKNMIILTSFRKMHDILRDVYKKAGSYNKFLKLLEDNYGCLPDEYTTFMHRRLK